MKDLATHALRAAKTNFDKQVEDIQSHQSHTEGQKLFAIIKLLANVAKEAKAGNCQEMAAVAFLFLMEQGIRPIEIVYSPAHTFVVIGRNPGSLINELESWGENTVICDPWGKQYKYSSGVLFQKGAMVYSPLTLKENLKKHGADKVAVGFAIHDLPTTESTEHFEPPHGPFA